ncbi:mannose-6-phosphate isomerase-like [Argonauta hians]
MADDPCVFPLKCAVQNYVWGKLGSQSEVARLSRSGNPDFKLQQDVPYAELWMGTHPNGPSKIHLKGMEGKDLGEWISEHPERLGKETNEYYKGELPFLFKVLSVRTSLSIQAHPNKIHAELLNRENPSLYKDANHKPELAIALTPFQGLCGFRVIQEVAKYLQDIPEFRTVVGNENAIKLITASRAIDMASHRCVMKNAFEAMMMREKETLQSELRKWISKIMDMDEQGEDISPYNGEVLLKLHREFPGDVGCFAVYFLNHITLQPGQAMFLDANLPHAYLSGDCMECMACSDNVVRAGLTVKYVDVHTLCKMLDYTGRQPQKAIFAAIQDTEDPYAAIFKPPVNDFAVLRIMLPGDVAQYQLRPLPNASICIVISGKAEGTTRSLVEPLKLRPGSVFFMSANEIVTLKLEIGSMLLFRAHPNL